MKHYTFNLSVNCDVYADTEEQAWQHFDAIPELEKDSLIGQSDWDIVSIDDAEQDEDEDEDEPDEEPTTCTKCGIVATLGEMPCDETTGEPYCGKCWKAAGVGSVERCLMPEQAQQ